MSMRNHVVLGLLGVIIPFSITLATDPLYSIVPIRAPGVVAEGYGGGIDGVNDLGQVLASYGTLDQLGNIYTRPFVYRDSAGSIEIPAPASWWLGAGGINNSGEVAVYGRPLADLDRDIQAYRYSAASGFQPLGNFGGTRTEAEAINNAGQVTGYSESANGRAHAYRYTDGVGLQNIGTAFNGSVGYAINDRGWVAGYGDGNAVLFRDEGNITLLPGVARGINNAGDVVGNTTVVPGHPTAFVYLNGGTLILGDAVFSQTILYDINNQNLAVGAGYLDGSLVPVLWSEARLGDPNAGLVDLNTLIPENSGWTLIGATAINDAGQIVGTGILNGEWTAFRLDVIPEPSTWALLGLGAVGLALARWRRK